MAKTASRETDNPIDPSKVLAILPEGLMVVEVQPHHWRNTERIWERRLLNSRHRVLVQPHAPLSNVMPHISRKLSCMGPENEPAMMCYMAQEREVFPFLSPSVVVVRPAAGVRLVRAPQGRSVFQWPRAAVVLVVRPGACSKVGVCLS